MDLKWLEDFICLHNTRSFRRAAEIRHVSQSAFSRRIKALEDWLGADLVDRASYPIDLTDAGTVFVDAAKNIINTSYHCREDLSMMRRDRNDTVIVATHPSLAAGFVPKFIRDIELPKPKPKFQIRNDQKVAELYLSALKSGTCDFLICYDHEATNFFPEAAEFEAKAIGEESLIPVTGDKSVHNKATDHYLLVQYSSYTNLGKIISYVIRKKLMEEKFKIAATASVAETVKALTLSGHGLAWLPKTNICRELADKSLTRVSELECIDVAIKIYRHRDQNTRSSFLWDQLT